jgi:hypothetical protein
MLAAEMAETQGDKSRFPDTYPHSPSVRQKFIRVSRGADCAGPGLMHDRQLLKT